MPQNVLETVLLLALPASGKSEVRKYLEHLHPDRLRDEFHMGANLQLDDFPYVHLMRRIDEELEKLNAPRVYFKSPDKPFQNPLEWGTLISMLNDDYENLVTGRYPAPASTARHLLERLDKSALSVGAPGRMGMLDDRLRALLIDRLEEECGKLLGDRKVVGSGKLEGKTVVIEFARGGPHGSSMPLRKPLGYRYSLSRLSEAILKKAVVLYIWVTPEESRRKNAVRANPDDPGSILHHGVPLEVMFNDYGCDDMDWLEANTQVEGMVEIEAHGKTFNLPIARFDNRVDKTSFLRNEPSSWKPDQVRLVHEGLKGALGKLGKKF